MPADLVIAGIGIAAAVEPLRAAGAEGTNGVDVDEHCRTTLPDVFAVGRLRGAREPLRRRRRASGWNWCRTPTIRRRPPPRPSSAALEPYDAIPWFWSNQYDLKLQTVGLLHGHDELVVRGDPAARSFSVLYLRDGRVVALDCVNAVKDYVQGRRLILDGAALDRARLADASIPLKEL